MVVLGIIIVMLSLLTAVGGALLALRIQYGLLDKKHRERAAWQQAQESRQRTWEVRQGKNMLDVEKKLGEQIKDVRKEFRDLSLQVQEKQQFTQAMLIWSRSWLVCGTLRMLNCHLTDAVHVSSRMAGSLPASTVQICKGVISLIATWYAPICEMPR